MSFCPTPCGLPFLHLHSDFIYVPHPASPEHFAVKRCLVGPTSGVAGWQAAAISAWGTLCRKEELGSIGLRKSQKEWKHCLPKVVSQTPGNLVTWVFALRFSDGGQHPDDWHRHIVCPPLAACFRVCALAHRDD